MTKKNIMLFSELNEEQVDELLQYCPYYSDTGLENVRNRVRGKLVKGMKPARHKKSLKKAFIAAAAAVFVFGAVAAQAGVLDLQGLFQLVFGEKAGYVAQYSTPLLGSATSNGIELKLLAAYRDEKDVSVYYTLTDTTKDRLSKNLTPYESFDFLNSENGGDGLANLAIEVLKYDAGTKTFTAVATGTTANENPYDKNGNAAFSISKILSDGARFDAYDKSIDLYSVLSGYSAKIQSGKVKGLPISGKPEYFKKYDDGVPLLENGVLNIPFKDIGWPWAYISNAGFVDGALHIQTKTVNGTYNLIDMLYFNNQNNEKVFGGLDHNVVMVNGASDSGGRYCEFIFGGVTDIEQLKGLKLEYEGWAYAHEVETPGLSVTFKVPEQMPRVEIPINKEITIAGDSISKGKLVLSPLYLKIYYENAGRFPKISDDVSLTYKDGAKITLTQEYWSNDLAPVSGKSGGTMYNFIKQFSNAGSVIEIDKVKSISINGQTFILP